MKEYNLLKRRFREFGGWRLVKEYAKLGIVPVVVKTFCRCVIKHESLRVIYPAIREKVCPMLVAKYKHIIKESKAKYESETLTHEHPKVVWWCWLQGEENAPTIVKACLNSLRRNLPQDYEIRVIDESSWIQWISLPDYIVEKRRKGHIPPALFSDLLRLELLIKYGGTWIDSTVLCTGENGSKEFQGVSEASNFLEADLFFFQYTPPGSQRFGGISNWFISAHSNNKVLMTMRNILMVYWRDYDCTLDYYIFHLFFGGMVRAYPEEINAMPYAYSVDALQLMKHWHEQYDQEKWNKWTSRVCFHKLSSRPKKQSKIARNSIYQQIIEKYKL
jgi:hypothetical protein